MSGPPDTPISTCMANITSMSKRRTPARTYARSDRQDGRASVQNFSDAPGKPIAEDMRLLTPSLSQRFPLQTDVLVGRTRPGMSEAVTSGKVAGTASLIPGRDGRRWAGRIAQRRYVELCAQGVRRKRWVR